MFRLTILVAGLTWLFPVQAALYTVGTGGTYDTIQAAITDALVAPGSDEIRVGSGTYVENLSIRPFGSGNMLEISGGWNATFSVQSDMPSVVDGNMVDTVAFVELENGDGLMLNNLRFQNGNDSSGGGLNIFMAGNAAMTIDDCEIASNTAADTRTSGGGLDVRATEDSSFAIQDSLIIDNQTDCSGNTDCRAGGIELQGFNSAQLVFNRNLVENNSVNIASGSAFAAGVLIEVSSDSVLTLNDNRIIGNTINGTSSNGGGVGLEVSVSGSLTARRNRVEANVANVPSPNTTAQVGLSKRGNIPALFTDTVIVDSGTKGIRASITGDGDPVLHLVNLTVANHATIGVQVNKFAAGGEITLSNSISVDSSPNTSIDAEVLQSNNLLTGSAGFINPAAGNYDLAPGSPAINAGNNTPPGGLGPTDVAGNPRIFDVTVDQGAYESQTLGFFLDGFEGP